jgi:hypothetical protein
MTLEKEEFSKEDFKKVFDKKFWNFCDKSPLLLKYKIIDNAVLLYDLSTDPEAKPLKFDFDYSKDEKYNIWVIKTYLVENCYPSFTVRKTFYRTPNSAEINSIMSRENMSFKEASLQKIKSNEERQFRVEKVFNSENRIVVREIDVQNAQPAIYFLKMPITIFIRELFSNPKEAARLFEEKAELVKSILDVNN